MNDAVAQVLQPKKNNKQTHTKAYNVTQRHFYYCVKRRCLLSREKCN